MVPVFIGGCERSGTTFLGSILGSGDGCVVTPESQFKMNILGGRKGLTEDPKRWKQILDNDFRFKLWKMEAPVPGGNDYSAYLLQLVEKFSEKVSGLAIANKFWIDHSPHNLMYAATLKKLFPAAKFIHIVRDGRGVFHSMKNIDWGAKNAYDAAYLWSRKLSFGFAAESYLEKDIIRIRYEDLLTDTETQLQRMREFTGIENLSLQNDKMKQVLPSYTHKQHALVGAAPQVAKATEWKTKLADREIEIFESVVKDQLEMLGYEPMFGAYAKGITQQEKRKQRIFSWFTYRLSKMKHNKRKHQ